MDRREFLKSTSVAAAAATTSAAGAVAASTTVVSAASPAATADPHVARGPNEFVLAVPQSLAHIEVMTSAHRLAARLQTAFGGARYVTVTTTVESGLEAISTGRADAYLGLESQHAGYHPAFQAFAAMPIGEHLDGPAHHAWLTSGGGRDLWLDLASAHGAIAFPAFHTGPSQGLFAERLFDTGADLKGARIGARGLAAATLRHLGALADTVADHDITAGISTGALLAAEPLMAPTSAVAHWSYRPGLTPAGQMLSLGLRTSTWATLSPAEQAAVEGYAAQSYLQAQADTQMMITTTRHLDAMRRWPVHTAMTSALQRDLETAATAAVDELAAFDATARAAVASYRAFRKGVDVSGIASV